MEKRPRLSDEDYEELLDLNRFRYAANAEGLAPETRQHAGEADVGFNLGRPEDF